MLDVAGDCGAGCCVLRVVPISEEDTVRWWSWVVGAPCRWYTVSLQLNRATEPMSGSSAPSAGPEPPACPPLPSCPDRPGPPPSYPAALTENEMKTQYVVVYPPPRYEIVGLLQQCSYVPVNEPRTDSTNSRARIACSEGVREGLQIIAVREHSGPGRAPSPPPSADLTTVALWPPGTPSASPWTPGRPGCGPWWSTSTPGWWTSPTGS